MAIRAFLATPAAGQQKRPCEPDPIAVAIERLTDFNITVRARAEVAPVPFGTGDLVAPRGAEQAVDLVQAEVVDPTTLRVVGTAVAEVVVGRNAQPDGIDPCVLEEPTREPLRAVVITVHRADAAPVGVDAIARVAIVIAIAYKAILNGYDALFTTAAELIEDLHTAAGRGGLHERIKRYLAPSVLVVDEVGYLTLRDNAANVLYHVVNARYLKRKSIIFTTNKPLTHWGPVLHDQDLAETIIDRVLERGRIITLDGPSMRNPKGINSPEA